MARKGSKGLPDRGRSYSYKKSSLALWESIHRKADREMKLLLKRILYIPLNIMLLRFIRNSTRLMVYAVHIAHIEKKVTENENVLFVGENYQVKKFRNQ